MKTSNKSLISQTENMDWTSEAIHIGLVAAFSIQAVYQTSSASIKLQASNDLGNSNASSIDAAGELVTNWSDLDNSVIALTEDGSVLYDVDNASYKWVRVVITGTGTVTSVRVNTKG